MRSEEGSWGGKGIQKVEEVGGVIPSLLKKREDHVGLLAEQRETYWRHGRDARVWPEEEKRGGAIFFGEKKGEDLATIVGEGKAAALRSVG